MKYNCIVCNYSTDVRQNWYSHKKSIKHIDICGEEDSNNLDMATVYNCTCCDYHTDLRQLWHKHKKTKKHSKKYKLALENEDKVLEVYKNKKNEMPSIDINKINSMKDNMIDLLCDKLKQGNSFDINEIMNNIELNDNDAISIDIEQCTDNKIILNNINVSVQNNVMNVDKVNIEKVDKVNIEKVDKVNIEKVNNVNIDNVNINYYGQEKNLEDHIDLKSLKKVNNYKKNPPKAIDFLLDKLYFSVPENNNIIYNNLRRKECFIMTEDGKQAKSIDETFEERTEQISNMDEPFIEKFRTNVDMELFSNINGFLWDGSRVSISEFRGIFKPDKKDEKYKNNYEEYKEDMKKYFNDLNTIKDYKKLKQRYIMNVYNSTKKK